MPRATGFGIRFELDRTTRYIRDAKARALEVLNEASPKLTALEKAMWIKLKRGERPAKTAMANKSP